MKKRPERKGWADIFIKSDEKNASTPERPNDSKPEESNVSVQTVEETNQKASYYLPATLIDRLEEVWLKRRRVDKKIQKSHLVAEILDKGLKEYEG